MVILWIQNHILSVCLILGTAVGCIWLMLFRGRLQLIIWEIPVFSVANTAAGMVCVSLFAGIESWGNPLSSGQSLYGGIFLLPLVYFAGAKLFRRHASDIFDIFAMCTVTTLLFARIRCIVAGCCMGSSVFGSGILWPTREMEILFYIVLLYVLYRLNKSQRHRGEIWPIYMIAYGIFRFITEWMRDEEPFLWFFHHGHVWSVLSIIIGCSVYFELRRKASTGKMR